MSYLAMSYIEKHAPRRPWLHARIAPQYYHDANMRYDARCDPNFDDTGENKNHRRVFSATSTQNGIQKSGWDSLQQL